MQNTVKNITTLRKILPHGAIKEISDKSGTTIFTVSRVFNGKSKNIKVIRAISEYIHDLNIHSGEIEAFIKINGNSKNE